MKRVIVLIEDEQGLSQSLSRALRDAGFECEVALNGEEGLEVVRARLPDLVLLDLILPGMNGVEVLRALKQDKKTLGIPVIVLTNIENSQMISEVVSIAKTDYLIKSNYSLDDVIVCVHRKIEEAGRSRKGAEV